MHDKYAAMCLVVHFVQLKQMLELDASIRQTLSDLTQVTSTESSLN